MDLVQILKKVFDIKPTESVLIVTDAKQEKNAKLFYSAAQKLSRSVLLVKKPVGKYSGEEPSKRIVEQMLKSDVIILITTNSLSHTKARVNASKKGARIASMPGFDRRMFKSLQADPEEMRRLGNKIKDALLKARKMRVVTASGTDISFGIRKKIWIDSGFYARRGLSGNLPAGEVYFSPLEGTAKGVIVVDSMKNGLGTIARKGTKIIVDRGEAVDISGNCRLSEYFNKIENARNIAEFGIGINKKAKVIGRILQDEKVFGTCHIAFGNSKMIGGKVYSELHTDAILFKPTIYADDKLIMRNGKLVV